MMLNLKTMQVYYWVAKLRSFSKAAERLNMTQPTVSQRISALEELFDTSILDRKVKPILPTAKGRVLFRHCEIILRQVAALEEEMKKNNRDEATIRLGVSETIAQSWLSEFLSKTRKEYPGIVFDIEVDVTASLQSALLDGELDMTFMLGPTVLNDYSCVSLGGFPLRFYGRSDLFSGEYLSRKEFLSAPVITYPRRAYPYGKLREILFRVTGTTPKIITSTSMATIRRMAMDGVGVALLAEDTVDADIGESSLVPFESEINLEPLLFFAYFPYGPGSGLIEEIAAIAQRVASEKAPISPEVSDSY